MHTLFENSQFQAILYSLQNTNYLYPCLYLPMILIIVYVTNSGLYSLSKKISEDDAGEN